jgi:hypothetical protein
MHLTYKETSDPNLEQGDLLLPTEYIKDKILKKYHPYYRDHPDNQFYIVLTQSCDLVKRGAECKAQYITLAPVRPLKSVLHKEFHELLKNSEPGAQPYASNRVKKLFEEFLSRLFNNNEANYFYLRKQPDKNLSDDMCAILSLSIAIKTMHYDECIKARILQVDDLFQAKLGWLVGQRYSRVGTPDWDKSAVDREIESLIKKTAIWLDDQTINNISKEIASIKSTAPETLVDTDRLKELVKNAPDKKESAINVLFEILVEQNILPAEKDPKKLALRRVLRSNSRFSNFF